MPDFDSTPPAFFVYGTLKRGEMNDILLGPYARSVEIGSIRGLLYDLGEFPALLAGEGTVVGEIVEIDTGDMPRLLDTLDRLEGYSPGDEPGSMYLRRTIEARTRDGRRVTAFTYFYNAAHSLLPPLDGLSPIENGEWTSGNAVPAATTAALETYRGFVRGFRHRLKEPPSPFHSSEDIS